MSNMTLEDIKETIRIKASEDWFVNYFEITIEDLVTRFADLIQEKEEDLPLELGMEYTPEEYEDR